LVLCALASGNTTQGKKLVPTLQSSFRQGAYRHDHPEWWTGLYDVRTEITDTTTRTLIERIRRQPIYLTGPLPTPVQVEELLPNAAARLRGQVRQGGVAPFPEIMQPF